MKPALELSGLLDLSAHRIGYRAATLADDINICCCCSCCCGGAYKIV